MSFLPSRGAGDRNGDPSAEFRDHPNQDMDEEKDLICPECGSEVFDVDNFCENCDAAVAYQSSIVEMLYSDE